MRPVHYTVRFADPASHYMQIEASFPVERGAATFELMLPVWTPGSYKVREYARHLEGLIARDEHGEVLSVAKTTKNRWRIEAHNPIHQVCVSYTLYCHELSVRTNWMDDQFALVIGAATFVTSPELLNHPCEVRVELPAGWEGSWSGMSGSGMSGGGNQYFAPDYDSLVDCPIVAGSPAVYTFEVDGKPHSLVNVGDAGLWEAATILPDLERIVTGNRALWGSLPYDKYLFINLLTGSSGGLEHRNSMVLMADRYAARTKAMYQGWLGLVSHEFFHVWNVKRLRPKELEPFDYEHEVYTRNLWIAEGFTHYYEPLLLRRSGLSTDDEFLGTTRPARQRGEVISITGLIEELQNTPGRLYQPVAQASFDAWIKQYYPDANSVNSAISYYTKGAVIAWLLDAKIRKATGDSRSLDGVMVVCLERFGGETGFTQNDFASVVHEVSGEDFTKWFAQVLDTTVELDYQEALGWFGLRFQPYVPDPAEKAWTGIQTKTDAGRLTIAKIPRDTPAAKAGLSPEDEILGLDGFRVTPEQWEKRMAQYRPGDRIAVLISRMERLLTVEMELGREPGRRWVVEIDPTATPEQREQFRRWVATRARNSATV